MKIKTSEMTGPALDWAVAKCEGVTVLPRMRGGCYATLIKGETVLLNYSTNWAQGGPIIEREWLQLTPWPNESDEESRWHCVQHDSRVQCHAFGPTALIAAMRCYVASKLGDEVDVPDELL